MADVTIKVCDRCKAEIKDRRGVAVYEPIFIRSILSLDLFRPGDYVGAFGFRHHDKFYQRNFDLCEECSNKLVHFMEGAELEMGKEEPDGAKV